MKKSEMREENTSDILPRIRQADLSRSQLRIKPHTLLHTASCHRPIRHLLHLLFTSSKSSSPHKPPPSESQTRPIHPSTSPSDSPLFRLRQLLPLRQCLHHLRHPRLKHVEENFTISLVTIPIPILKIQESSSSSSACTILPRRSLLFIPQQLPCGLLYRPIPPCQTDQTLVRYPMLSVFIHPISNVHVRYGNDPEEEKRTWSQATVCDTFCFLRA